MKLFRLIGAVVWAIPVYFLWNYLAPIYLTELPPQYLDIPFWHIAGAFVLLKIISIVIFPRHHFRHACMHKLRRFARHHDCGRMTQTYYHR